METHTAKMETQQQTEMETVATLKNQRQKSDESRTLIWRAIPRKKKGRKLREIQRREKDSRGTRKKKVRPPSPVTP